MDSRWIILALVGGLLLTAACDESLGPQGATLVVTVTTSGAEIDRDGYLVQLDTSTTVPVAVNGSVRFSGLAPGAHDLALEDVAPNCGVDSDARRIVQLTAGDTLPVAFPVTCGATLGALVFIISTTGADPDSDGYTIILDGWHSLPLAPVDTVELSGLSAGNHSIVIDGIAANCALDRSMPFVTTVVAGVATQVALNVTCDATVSIAGVWDWTEEFVNPVCHDTGTYVFSQSGTSFTGTSDQVGVCIGPNGPARNDGPAPVRDGRVGGRQIQFWVGPAGGSGCTYTGVVVGNPPDSLSGTASCGGSTGTWGAHAGRPVASVEIQGPSALLQADSAQLVAALRDTDGYRIFSRPVSWASDNTAVVTVSTAGVVKAVGAGQANISATSQGTTGTNALTVTAAGVLRVAAVTSGPDPDPSGYLVLVDAANSAWVGANGSATLSRVAAVSHSVGLTNIAKNCAVTSANPQRVDVTAGDTTRVEFQVSCVRAEKIAFHVTTCGYYDCEEDVGVIYDDGSELMSVGLGNEPAWAPDGTRLAFRCIAVTSAICSVRADGTGMIQLTSGTDLDFGPAWSPDGARIAFARSPSSGGPAGIYVMNADGTGIVRVIGGDTLSAVQPSWSPEGSMLVFTCVRGAASNICRIGADGAGLIALTNDLAGNGTAAWKPDGTAIAFSTGRFSGGVKLALMNPDGSGVTLIGTGILGISPSWSHTGTRLAFNDATGILIVNADGSGAVRLTSGGENVPSWRP